MRVKSRNTAVTQAKANAGQKNDADDDGDDNEDGDDDDDNDYL